MKVARLAFDQQQRAGRPRNWSRGVEDGPRQTLRAQPGRPRPRGCPWASSRIDGIAGHDRIVDQQSQGDDHRRGPFRTTAAGATVDPLTRGETPGVIATSWGSTPAHRVSIHGPGDDDHRPGIAGRRSRSAGDAINRELAHGHPRDVAAWLGPQRLARAILYATVTNWWPSCRCCWSKARRATSSTRCRCCSRLSLISSRIVSDDVHAAAGLLRVARAEGLRGLHRRRARGAGWQPPTAASSNGAWATRPSPWAARGLAFTAGCAALPLLGTAFFPKDLHDVFTVNVFHGRGLGRSGRPARRPCA